MFKSLDFIDKEYLKDICDIHTRDAAFLIEYYSNEIDKAMGAYVITHSLGGPVGFELITKYPQLVRRMLSYEPAWEGKRTLSRGIRAILPPIIFADERGPIPEPEVIENITTKKAMINSIVIGITEVLISSNLDAVEPTAPYIKA